MAERPIEQVEKLVRYFQFLVDTEGKPWDLGLDVAHEAADLLRRTDVSRAEVKRLLARLETGEAEQGSAWYELLVIMRAWFMKEFPS